MCHQKYLANLIREDTTVYCPKQKDTVKHTYHYLGKHSKLLLGYLENLLKSKQLCSTGFDEDSTPSISWTKDAILYLEPDDKLGLLYPVYNGWGNCEDIKLDEETIKVDNELFLSLFC